MSSVDRRLPPGFLAEALRADARAGLASDPKSLPPKWFYDAQGSALRYGDILCVRTGWVDKYLTLDAGARGELAATMVTVSGFSSAGLAGSEEMSRFLWDSGVAALPCDNPSVEVVPADPADGSLHQRLIPHLGFAIGELFDFAPLAHACRRAGRYEFLFTSVPLNATGAVGSPANAVAVL